VANECQPGRAIGTWLGPKVFGKHATRDTFVDLDANGVRDLLSDSHAAEARIAPLGIGFATMRRRRRGQAIFTIHQ
jgi:hypothetical protein